jgi:hypothetical protein
MAPYDPNSDDKLLAPEASEGDQQPGDTQGEDAAAAAGEDSGDVEAPPPDEEPLADKKPAAKKKPEMNPDFKELQETGQWGKVSNTERNVVIVVILLIVAAVIASVVVVVSRGDSSDDATETGSPTPAPTSFPVADQYKTIVEAIQGNSVLNDTVTDLASEPEAYQEVDGSAPVMNRAFSWVLFEDDLNDREHLVSRFALASIYYDLDGANWPKNEGWLSEASVCEWEGIDCDRFGIVTEIDLSNQGITGPVPPYFSLIPTAQAIWLRNNEFSGELQGEIFGSIPNLTILYLENNKFTGTIPSSLIDNGVLSK